MRQNIVWKILFTLTSLASIWLGLVFLWKAVPYFRFALYAPAKAHSWEIIEIEPSVFSVKANYEYRVNGRDYLGSYLFSEQRFPNEHVAREAADLMEKQRHGVWYQKKHPEKAIMIRIFPYKALFRFLLSLGVMVYFLWLREYLRRFAAA
ncbi:MAG: hypothetical protein Tsb0015_05110 [Simkaniaceae bacterium]